MPPCEICCSKFWEDIKDLRKEINGNQLDSNLENETFQTSTDYTRIESIPLIKAIRTYIVNGISNNALIGSYDKLGRQPYLDNGITLWKTRYAFNKQGKSNGLRIVFAFDSNFTNLFLIFIARKQDCANERKLEQECFDRLSNLLQIQKQ